MFSAGFEPSIPAVQRPQSYALDRTATGISSTNLQFKKHYLETRCLFLSSCTTTRDCRVSTASQFRFSDAFATLRKATIISLCCYYWSQGITRQAVYVSTNIQPRSFSHCDRGLAISITHSECVPIALVVQHAERMHRSILLTVACLALA